MPTQQQNALMQRFQSMRPGARQAPASQISKPIGAGGQGVPPSQDGAQLRQLQQQLVGQSAVNPQRTPPTPQPLGRAGGFHGPSGPSFSPGPYTPGMQVPLSPYNTTTQQNIMGGMPAGYNPAMLQGMQGLGSSPTGFGGQNMPFGAKEMTPLSPQQQEMVLPTMGGMSGQPFDGMGMAGGPAPYSPGMQIPLSPYNTTTQQNIMGGPAGGPSFMQRLSGLMPQQGGSWQTPANTMPKSMGGFGPNVNNFGGPSPSPSPSFSPGPYTPGMQVPLNPYNTTTQQNIMGQTTPQAPNQLSSTGSPFYSGIASLFGSKK